MTFARNRPKRLMFKSPLGGDPHIGHLKVTPEPAFPLPLTLKELCLLEVINEIDSYPTEVLASQPLGVRCRLLNNVPAIDLCQLESTPIAEGVDINKVWKRRCVEGPDYGTKAVLALRGAPDSRRALFKKIFQINVQGSLANRSYCSNLESEMTSVFEDFKRNDGKNDMDKEKYLFEIVSNALSYSSELDLRTIAHELVSIRGDLLLYDVDAKPRQMIDGQTIWNVQKTSLVVSTCKHKLESAIGYPVHTKYEDVRLTPHRLLPICNNITDQLELLLLLMKTSNLKPSSVNLDMGPGGISREILKSLLMSQIISDNRLSCPSSIIDFTSILKSFLERVFILRLQCQNFTDIGVLISLLDAATLRGKDSQLKSLFCCLPDIYSETVQPFTALFSLQNFQLLHLHLTESANPQTLTKLLQGFLIAPCSHSQRLVIDISTGDLIQLPSILNERRLALLNLGGATVPDCAVQHKIIRTTIPDYVLQFVLLLPTVRLNELVLNANNYSNLHLCACHPDIQVAKIVINLYIRAKDRHILLATMKDDLIALLNKPNLQEISFGGKWESCKEAKLGLLLGLGKHPRHLKKIFLDMYGYNEEELRELWTTLAMLKRLYRLEIVLRKSFIDMLQKFTDNTIYKSWIQLLL